VPFRNGLFLGLAFRVECAEVSDHESGQGKTYEYLSTPFWRGPCIKMLFPKSREKAFGDSFYA